MPQKREYVRFKNFERKINHHSHLMQILELFQCLKIVESKIQMSLVLTKIKMLLVVMGIN